MNKFILNIDLNDQIMFIRVIRSEIMGGSIFRFPEGGQRVGALLNPEGGHG